MSNTIVKDNDYITDMALFEHYRCPESFARFRLTGSPSRERGYFRFGSRAICYGQCATGFRSARATDELYDALQDVVSVGPTLGLPFNPSEIVANLRHERYLLSPAYGSKASRLWSAFKDVYYQVRPLLPRAARRSLQRAYFKGWREIAFPRWPVDSTVEEIFETQVAFSLEVHSVESMPFIWFWPDGAQSCVMMTHDVETSLGRDFCNQLMDVDDAFGIKSSFQVVPEGRYIVPKELLNAIRSRGFEIGVHDLNHDGRLFSHYQLFKRRAQRINQYGKEYGASGFRAAVLYRNLEWLDTLTFAYDMSVPNVGHLEAQRGGCCTVMPFFVGDVLELPTTTTQDFSLFHILKQHSIDAWKRQIATITEKHGLASFIVHPDYVLERRALDTYKQLLAHLARLKSLRNIWTALPREINQWWRERNRMTLTRHGDKWVIEGPGSERGRVAHARVERGRVMYRVQSALAGIFFWDRLHALYDVAFAAMELARWS
jgi:hypothetical protein